MFHDTIAAVSTPRGRGGVALIRISGADAIKVASRVFLPKNGKQVADLTARRAVYGSLLAPDASGAWQSIDDGIATVFRAPASFTGEDTVELCCHGGILLTERLLTACFLAGARAAEAGEFTRRAVLNGKLGLSSAESLGDLLEAGTEEQLTLAHAGMHGKVEGRTGEIYASLGAILASIYVKIDYPDEDLADLSREEIVEALQKSRASLSALCDTYRTGHAIAEGVRTVICGRPNVGKSSLYNRIVGRDAAIVTDVAGTTRDVLTERASLGRVTLRLFDTAGLHTATDPVERIGIERAEGAMNEAELILAVLDACDINEDDRALLKRLKDQTAPVILLLNKSDLAEAAQQLPVDLPNTVCISAKSGEGMEALTDAVERLFLDGALDTRCDAVLTNARQHAAARTALSAVDRALEALVGGYPIDLSCTDVESAMSALCELDGRAVSEDIISQIFSHFCVGK